MDILKENKSIRMLKFSSAGMHGDGGGGGLVSRAGAGNSNARVLHYILEYNKNIEHLDLSNTGLGNDGIIEIAEGIRKNNTLESLNLSYNNFGEKGTETLRQALLENNSIKHLDLSYNGLGFRSINNLVCMCKAKRTPMTVVTNGNYVFEEILNGVSHGVCFLVSIVGSCLLINEAANEQKYSLYHFWSCVLYSFSLMFLFLSSCLFHSFFMLPQASRILQILDHVGISFLIAGSYTPLLLISSHHHITARFVVVFEWLAALFGTVVASKYYWSLSITHLYLF